VNAEAYEFDERIERAATPPASWYTDGRVLEAERRRVFGRTWQLAGRAEQAAGPGQFFTAEVAGEPIVVVRDAGAYGYVMASEYNGRALPSEVFVRGGKVVNVSRSPGKSAWLERRLKA
jgi:hypothetical protein